MISYISVPQAAARYSLSQEHIRLLLRTRKVQGQRFGPVWAVDETSLLAYLATDRKRGRKPRREEPSDAA